MNRKKVVMGVIMIVIGIVAFVIGQQIHSSGYRIAMWQSANRGEAIMLIANFVRFGGVGVGALGAIIALLSFLEAGSDQLHNENKRLMELRDLLKQKKALTEEKARLGETQNLSKEKD